MHHGYRLKGNAGSKSPIPMKSVKPLAARFYQLKPGHAPVDMFLKWFGHRDDYKCWWCGSRCRAVAQMRKYLFRHCIRWKEQQTMLWKEVGKATWWRGGECRHMQISELVSMEKWDKAVMDFLAGTVARKFPPKTERGVRAGGQRGEEYDLADSLISSIFCCILF
jgi:hypothetical protein